MCILRAARCYQPNDCWPPRSGRLNRASCATNVSTPGMQGRNFMLEARRGPRPPICAAVHFRRWPARNRHRRKTNKQSSRCHAPPLSGQARGAYRCNKITVQSGPSCACNCPIEGRAWKVRQTTLSENKLGLMREGSWIDVAPLQPLAGKSPLHATRIAPP